MGNWGATRLLAICLTAMALAIQPGTELRDTNAAEPTRVESPSRLVRIDIAGQPPLPPLVPISLAPPPPVSAVSSVSPSPRPLPGPASPPLVAISYAPAPARTAVAPLAIASLPLPRDESRPPALPAPKPTPVYAAAVPPVIASIPAPASMPEPAVRYTPPPAYQTALLPPPLPVYVPKPLPAPLPPLMPPPLPVYVPQSAPAPAPAPLPLPLPAPLPFAVGSSPLVPPPLPVASPVLPPPPMPLPPLQPPALPSQATLPPPLPAASPQAPAGGKPTDAITIASFNIQVFGESKISKPQVVDVLARVVRNFDVVAIQEVRAKSDSVIPQFVSAINADGSRYQFVIGPRLGRTVSKEQYTFIYDSNRIEVDPSSVGTSPNPGDRLHRPPLHARFRVRANPPESGFSFWLVDTHTDPDEVATEVNALAEVFQEMKALRPDEDDVILLGDLNAGPPQFGKIKQIPGVGWAVSGVTTNTRRSKTYDNLIFDQRTTTEYTGRWGVLDLQNTFGLSLDKALEVSDHNPVWAAFRPLENPGGTRMTAAPSGVTIGR